MPKLLAIAWTSAWSSRRGKDAFAIAPSTLKRFIRKVIRLDIAFNRQYRKSFSDARKGGSGLNHYKS
jgi:hypothetical protein